MEGDEGTAVQDQTVPAIGGMEGRAGMSPEAKTVPVVASAHLTDGPRAEGVMYPENPGVGGPEGNGFPAGTSMTDSTPSDNVN